MLIVLYFDLSIVLEYFTRKTGGQGFEMMMMALALFRGLC